MKICVIKSNKFFFLVVVPRCEDIKYKRPLGTNIGYIHLKSFDIIFFVCVGKKIDFSTDIMSILLRKKKYSRKQQREYFVGVHASSKKKKNEKKPQLNDFHIIIFTIIINIENRRC